MAEFEQRTDWAMGLMFGLAIGDAMGAPIEFEDGREPDDYITKYMTGGAHGVSKANSPTTHPWPSPWLRPLSKLTVLPLV